jgi:hypothetical protein
MILAFVVDTNESMGVRSRTDPAGRTRGAGLSPLDWAKTAVEHVVKARQRVGAKDQYLLLSTDDSPACVKFTWGDNLVRFEEQVSRAALAPGVRCPVG